MTTQTQLRLPPERIFAGKIRDPYQVGERVRLIVGSGGNRLVYDNNPERFVLISDTVSGFPERQFIWMDIFDSTTEFGTIIGCRGITNEDSDFQQYADFINQHGGTV